ncbi:MAG: sulfate ABC transporter permease subunit CysT [Anaerolineae bacterium]|nr:sulfate ABC transporter permease subunit CysT [Anaerolineae bacterium]
MTELSLSRPVSQPQTTKPRTSLQAPWGRWGLRIAALSYLAAFILVPIFVVNIEGFRNGIATFWGDVTRPVALSAIGLSVWTAAVMAVVNAVMGVLTAYVLVYYKFPGKALFNTLVDLPFAIPALVTGVMLVLLYGPQTAVGSFLDKTFHFRVLFAPPGIVLALLFISFPFVIRTVQPVLVELDFNQQEAAYTLGASEWTTFRRVIFPAIRPALITGTLLSFARALGEFGSIIVVAGNVPMKSQTAAVYIYGQVESGNMQAASAVSVVLLFIAFGITLVVDLALKRGWNHA